MLTPFYVNVTEELTITDYQNVVISGVGTLVVSVFEDLTLEDAAVIVKSHLEVNVYDWLDLGDWVNAQIPGLEHSVNVYEDLVITDVSVEFMPLLIVNIYDMFWPLYSIIDYIICQPF